MIDLSLFEKLKTNYQTAYPFPYVVIDNFLPEFLVSRCLSEVKDIKDWEWGYNRQKWAEPFQVNKFYLPDETRSVDVLEMELPTTTLILDYLNSPDFLIALEKLTGIKKLFRDPLLMGGGIHKINKGGKLGIHKDYNIHPETKQRRKLNLLLYLNKEWDTNWGGNLELWNKEVNAKVIEVEPIFNRAVIFTIDDAPHGHPYPLNCPINVSRYSLALYYFVDEIPNDGHTVIFYRNNDLGIEEKKHEKIFKTS
jgi:Rps23 Pro-64 3,4-dihydroxylase Tpa1-like proline 4-hydroxylase